MNWYLEGWKRYAQFSGRATREAFWVFTLVNIVITLCLVASEVLLQIPWTVEAIYSLLIFLPMASLTVRRLHDTNRSAWWLLVMLLPVVGMITLFVFLVLPSESRKKPNNYPLTNLIL